MKVPLLRKQKHEFRDGEYAPPRAFIYSVAPVNGARRFVMRVGVITASDKGYAGDREDLSGKTIVSIMESNGYEVAKTIILPDDKQMLADEMISMSDEGIHLILTTGGTGFSSRDVTPEATKMVIEKEAAGIPMAILNYSLKITDRAMLSRATAGIRKETLIVNLPGSPKAVEESLTYILPALKHGLDILLGRDAECARS